MGTNSSDEGGAGARDLTIAAAARWPNGSDSGGGFFFLENQDPRKGRNTLRSLSPSLPIHTHISLTPKSNNLACAPQPRIEKSHNLLFPFVLEVPNGGMVGTSTALFGWEVTRDTVSTLGAATC